jgi:hypothetical protein
MSPSELEDLREAKALLENPGLAAKISDVVGSPIERGFELLPAKWTSVVTDVTQRSLETALEVALRSMNRGRIRPPSNAWHKLAASATGAAGGALGLMTLPLELPISTSIMLRSIADIARSEGENLETPEARIQCVQVLALGGRSRSDDAAELGYFAARTAMARAVSEATRYLAQHGAVQRGAPALVQLIGQVAARFSIAVSEKAAAQAIPVVGALAGAVINALFIDHFQDTAKGHFVLRRLERAHGVEEIEKRYAAL